MRVCHGFTARFDDPNLVSCAGLAPVLDWLSMRACKTWWLSMFGSTSPVVCMPG